MRCAIILASAGLIRLGMAQRITQPMAVEASLPAGGQGAVGIELRDDDSRTLELIRPLHHEATARCVGAERALNTRLEGGCQVPIAAYAIAHPDQPGQLWLRGLVGSNDGETILRAESSADESDFESLGIAVAEDLLGQGAAELLAAAYA